MNPPPARQGKRWTPEEHQDMLHRCKKGQPTTEIANILQRTSLAIEWRLVDCVRKEMQDGGATQRSALKLFGIKEKDYVVWCQRIADSIDERRKVSPIDTLASLFASVLHIQASSSGS